MPGICPVSGDVWLPVSPSAGSLRQPHYGMRAAQRSASGAPLAGMEIGTADGTGQIRKTPRFTSRASGVTCTRLLGRMDTDLRMDFCYQEINSIAGSWVDTRNSGM